MWSRSWHFRVSVHQFHFLRLWIALSVPYLAIPGTTTPIAVLHGIVSQKSLWCRLESWCSIKISLKFVPKGPINNIPALVQIMACAVQATSHYLNQCWLVYRRIYASPGLKELINSLLNLPCICTFSLIFDYLVSLVYACVKRGAARSIIAFVGKSPIHNCITGAPITNMD